MTDASLVGGSEDDQRRILEQHDIYLDLNARFDWAGLQDVWSDASEAVFFNLNGHTYNGREQWTRLWQYYLEHMETGQWVPFDMGGVVTGDLAVGLVPPRDQSALGGQRPAPGSVA